MVALTAAPVIHDLVATIGVSDADKLIGDLFDCLVPADFFEGSVFHFL